MDSLIASLEEAVNEQSWSLVRVVQSKMLENCQLSGDLEAVFDVLDKAFGDKSWVLTELALDKARKVSKAGSPNKSVFLEFLICY